MARPRLHKASPWPFVGMAGLAVAFFFYAASGLVAPWWGVLLLMAIWVLLVTIGVRWWTPYPARVLLLPLVAVVVWLAVVSAGGAWFGWTA